MKKLYVALYCLISFSIISCSSDDDNIVVDDPQTNDPSKLFKKVERFKNNAIFYDRTVNYDSDNRIQSIHVNKYQASPFTSMISVEYSENSISSIREVLDYQNEFITDVDVTYSVSIGENLVTLTSEDVRVEITHTNGYVDSIEEILIENSGIIRRSYLTRDSNQNLTSIQFSNGNVINTYSDFDSDKKEDPSGVVVDVMNRDYIALFELKITANNPRTTTQSILGTAGPLRTYTYEYDEEGYITKINDPNLVNYLDIFYIEE